MEEKTLSPADILQIIKYRKWGLILPFIAVFLISGIIALVLPAYFRSTATILIEEQEIPQDFVIETVTSYVEKRLQTINQRIMSIGTMVDIIKQFNLYQEMQDSYTMEEIVDQMRSDIDMQSIDADVIDRKTGRPTKATIAFTLSYQGKNADTVLKVANTLVSLYLKENVEIRERQAKETSTFLEDEQKRVKEDLENIESKIRVLKEENINVMPELMQVNIQNLASMERSLEAARQQLQSLKEREGYLEVQLAGVSTENVDMDKRHLDELKLQLINLRTEFSENYPDVVKLKSEIQSLEKSLNASGNQRKKTPQQPDNPAYITLSSQLSSLRSEMQLANANIASLEAQKSMYQERIDRSPKVEEAYNSLLMEKNNTQAKYNDLTAKTMEAKISQGLEQDQKGERFTLIDPPRFPEKPFKPNRILILLIGLILAVGAGFGTVILQDLMDTSIRDPEALASAMGAPVLSVLPEILTAEDLKKRRLKWRAIVISIIAGLILSVIVFHLWVMDLNVLWAKVMRHIAR